MRIKFKIKKWILFFIEGWNWKEKLFQQKKIKRMQIEIEIKNKCKFFIEEWNWN